MSETSSSGWSTMVDDPYPPGRAPTARMSFPLYPCDAGTGSPQGPHHFQAGPTGLICCTLCGKEPRK